MTNNIKEISKELIYMIGMFILVCLLLLTILSNFYFYPYYVDNIEKSKIKFLDCDYWEKNPIPEKINVSEKWKIITTVGECEIIEKKYFLEQNKNDDNIFILNLSYMDLRYNARSLGNQAQNYLKDLKGK